MADDLLLRVVLNVFLVTFCFSLVSSVFFYVAEGEEKCFIEEIPIEIKLIGDHWTQVYDEQRDEYLPVDQDFSLSVVVSTPDNKLLLSQVDGSKGSFNFTSSASGEHRICFQPGSTQRPLSAGQMLAVHVDLRSGQLTNNYTEIQSQDRLTELQLRVRQLADQVQEIQRELNYQREREKYFNYVNYNTNMWIFWWPVLRAIYVVVFVIGMTSTW